MALLLTEATLGHFGLRVTGDMLVMGSGLNFDKGKNRAILYIYHFALNLALNHKTQLVTTSIPTIRSELAHKLPNQILLIGLALTQPGPGLSELKHGARL